MKQYSDTEQTNKREKEKEKKERNVLTPLNHIWGSPERIVPQMFLLPTGKYNYIKTTIILDWNAQDCIK